MYCQNCQKEVNNNSSYCPYCGQKIRNNKLFKIFTVTITIILLILIVIIGFIIIDNNNFKSRNFSDYFNPNIGGVGIVFGYNDKNELIIRDVKKNSPASEAGIHINDLIVKVNGKDANDIEKVSKIMRGKLGTKLNILIKRNNQEKEYTIVRGKIFGNDGYYELTDKVYLRQDYLKYDNGIYYFWLKRLPGAFGIKEENKNISYISELIAVDIINQKFADVEMYVYDKNNHIIDQMVSKQGKVEFETIAPDTIAQSFLFFVRQLDSEIPNRYKKRLKGYFN